MNSSAHRDTDVVDIVCVGAGFAGLYLSHRAAHAGRTFAGFERAPELGGTWYWNRYPGARCDIESVYYSYSFSEELQQEWEWSERFATQPEILRYLNHVADRFDLRRHFTFGTSVERATWLEDEALWVVDLDSGRQQRGRYLITAVGPLSTAKDPDIPGIANFVGTRIATSDWDVALDELAGRRIGVIGTGSSGVQCIPLIAEVADHLTVFQRTPNYVMPARNAALTSAELATIKADYHRIREQCRRSTRGFPDRLVTDNAFDVPDSERRRRYEAAYEVGGFTSVGDEFCDLLTDVRANETAASFLRAKVREVVADARRAELLEPRYHAFGAKRTCFGTDYYETFNRPNVDLVALREEPILAMTGGSVITSEREIELDVLVLSTGFDAVTGSLLNLNITTSSGRSLAAAWADGPHTYLGLTTAGFPNLFMIGGPQSPGVLSNFVVSIEQHVDWIVDLLAHADRRDVCSINTKPNAQQDWERRVDTAVDGTLYATTESWYRGSNVSGKPSSFLAYAGGVGKYREICDDIAARGYPGLQLDCEPQRHTTAVTTGAVR